LWQARSTRRAQQAIKNGDVLTGQLNAMRSRAKGKRVNTFQLVSGPAPAAAAERALQSGNRAGNISDRHQQ